MHLTLGWVSQNADWFILVCEFSELFRKAISKLFVPVVVDKHRNVGRS